MLLKRKSLNKADEEVNFTKAKSPSPDLIFGEPSLDQLIEGLVDSKKGNRWVADGWKRVLHQLRDLLFRVAAEELREELKDDKLCYDDTREV
jgi:hypothetical protein